MQFYLWAILTHITDSNENNSVLLYLNFTRSNLRSEKKSILHSSQTPTLLQRNDKDLILFVNQSYKRHSTQWKRLNSTSKPTSSKPLNIVKKT
jgi:hypothetical protein